MKAAQGQSAIIACLFAAFALFTNGCSVGRKSMAIDSNSRTPFFGLELKERAPKDSSSTYRSIGITSKDLAKVEIAYPTTPSFVTGSSKPRTNQPAVRAIVESENVIHERQTTNQEFVEVQPLPISSPSRADSRQNRRDLLTSQATVDFQ